MPRDKDLKRVVRTRMAKTGESYTTARARIIEKSGVRSRAQPAPASSRPDHAALAGKRDEVMREKTGRDWEQWVRELDRRGAHEMSHTEIARLVAGEYEIPGWWAQTVTVGYERIRGLREVGQRRGGSFEANKSKTFAVSAAELFERVANGRKRARWWPGVKVDARAATSPPSVRVKHDDGTVTMLWFVDKGPEKSTLTLTVRNLPDRAAVDRSKSEWNERLSKLAEALR